MKILAAVDGSPYSKRMLAYLAAHDEWLGAHHEYTLHPRRAGGAFACRGGAGEGDAQGLLRRLARRRSSSPSAPSSPAKV